MPEMHRQKKSFKEATEAYNVLSNPEKKKLYDQFGHAAFDGSAGGSGAYGYENGLGGGTYSYTGPNGNFHEYHFEGGDMDDILKNIFGGLVDLAALQEARKDGWLQWIWRIWK